METQDTDLPPPKKPKLDDNPTENNLGDTDFTEDVIDPDSKEFTVSKDNYDDLVTPEEVEKLREFKVLDETKSNDEDSHDEDSDSSDGKQIDDEEIEKMLEENLPEGFKGAPKVKERPFITISKIVLEEKGVNHFEVLPLDWMMIQHYSGMPLYMHRTTRVCTLSKPYFLGKGNARRHDIPLSAIPCLAYRRALDEEEKQKEIDRRIEEQVRNHKLENTNQQNAMSNINEQTRNVAVNIVQTNDVNRLGKSYFAAICDRSLLDNLKGNKRAYWKDDKTKCPHSRGEGKEMTNHADNTNVCNKKKIDCDNKQGNMQMESNSLDEKAISDNIDTKTTLNTNDNNNKVIQDSLQNDLEKVVTDIQQSSSDNIDKAHNNLNDNKCKDNILAAQLADASVNEKLNEDDTTHQDAMIIEDNTIKQETCKNVQDVQYDTNTDVTATENKIDPENSENVQNTGKETASNDANKGKEGCKGNFDDISLNRRPVTLPGGIVMAPPRVETVSTSLKTQHLTAEQVNDYCKKLFKFKVVKIMHFKRWADRRKYNKYNKARKTLQYPTLSEGTKLITIPMQHNSQENGGKASKRDWVMSMNGRSYLSVFHEYVGRALQKQPVYEFKNLENASTPYQATVYIGGMQYGVGYGSSKRQAKEAAARASVHILIPEMKDELDAHDNRGTTSNDDTDFSFFDHVGIEDPRITDFCAATCEPSPHAILKTCLLRNFGTGERHINVEMKKLEYQKIELTMKVGKHTATVACKNKKTAKQRASQAILQALHPHVRSWGSLLRLYGSKSVKSCKEKKLEEQQITLLQDKARHNEPNYAVLEKLRREMLKLKERDAAFVPIGTFLLTDSLPTHSNSDLNNVEL